MNNFKRLSFSWNVCSLLLLAYSSVIFTTESVAATPAKKEKEVEILGQVFIVKKDGSNVKLALVAVSAFPEKSVEDQIQKTRAMVLQQAKPAMASLSDAKKVRDDAQATLELVEEQGRVALKKYYVQNLSSSLMEIMERTDKLKVERARWVADRAESKVREYVEELEIRFRSSSFLEGLSMPTAIAKTDADGKFALSVPPGNYVLIANATRLTGSSTETYEWLVKTDARKMKQNVMLSNDNLFEIAKACQECVLIRTAD